MADEGIRAPNVPAGLAISEFLGIESLGTTRSLRRFSREQVLGTIEALTAGAQAGGGVAFLNKAEADANLGYDAYQLAWIVLDANPNNNGIYQKNGPSGSGSWRALARLPYSFYRALNVGAGTANAIQATNANPLASPESLVVFNITAANTAQPVTVQFNGGAVLTVLTAAGNNPSVGGFLPGMLVAGYIFGNQFRMLSDQASSAIQAAAEAAAATAQGYGASSSTSLTLSAGSKTLATQANLAYRKQRVRLISTANAANYMEGEVTAYAGTAMTVNVDFVGPTASGTFADWQITSVGGRGAGDLLSSLNLADLPDKNAARTTLFAAPQDLMQDPLFYNGAMLSDIRNEGDYYQAPNYPATELYTLEQVRAQGGAGCVLLVKRDVGIVNQGFSNSMQVYCQTAKSSSPVGELDHLEWTIEATDIARLGWGTANAKPLTIQFWFADSVSTIRSIQMMPGNNFCSCVKSFTTVAGQYVFRTVTFPALTAAMCATFGGTMPAGVGAIGLKMLIDLGSGSSFVTASPDAWGAGTSTVYPGAAFGATAFTRNAGGAFNITGIQEDVGSVALPYRHLRRDVMERKIQRYMYKNLPQGVKWIAAGGSGNWAPHSYVSPTDALVSGGGVDVRWPVEMARAPTVIVRSPVSVNSTWRNYSASADSGAAAVLFPYQRGCYISNPGASGDLRGSLMQVNVLANANLGGD